MKRWHTVTIPTTDHRQVMLISPVGYPDSLTLQYPDSDGDEIGIDLHGEGQAIATAIRDAAARHVDIPMEDGGGAPLTIAGWEHGGAVIHGRPQDPPGDEQIEFSPKSFLRLADLLDTPPQDWAAEQAAEAGGPK
jgi:hypothetical protein